MENDESLLRSKRAGKAGAPQPRRPGAARRLRLLRTSALRASGAVTLVVAAFSLAPAISSSAENSSRFRIPDAKTPLVFPRDDGSHDDARVEWWYVTGQVETSAGERRGFQLTFFRTGILDAPRPDRTSSWAARNLFFAHFARTDPQARTFRFSERFHRSGPAAFAKEDRLDVENEDWQLGELGGRFVLHARDGDEELSLLLRPEKPPVLHGENGLSRKGPEPEEVSRYVSFTRLEGSGWWTSGDADEPVAGLAWMDHEWGPLSLGREAAGWDWFGLQLDDGRDLMLYRIRKREGGASEFSSGTLVAKDGKAESLKEGDFSIEETARWKSPRSGGVYPSRWILRVPKASLDVEVVPLLADQELVTEKSTHVTYWEGACDVLAPGSRRAIGRAYVELTGYAGPGMLGALRSSR